MNARHKTIRSAATVFVILSIFAGIEVFVFNAPFWSSLNVKSTTAKESYGPGLYLLSDGSAKVTDAENAWRDISSSEPITYLYLNHTVESEVPRELSWKTATKKPTDGGWYKSSSTIKYNTKSEASRYSHIGGGATQVRFNYQVENGQTIPLDEVTVNPKVPFRVDPLRIGLELLIAVLIIAFRPGSALYRKRYVAASASAIGGLTVVYAIEAAIIVGAWILFGGPTAGTGTIRMDSGMYYDYDQYCDLANALLHGRTSLDLPVNSDLAAMSNPYDAATRIGLGKTSADSTPIFFDVAFYSGKYYCYFGIMPALLLFAPYKLITGYNLPTGIAVLTLILLVTFVSMFLISQLARLCASKAYPVSLGAVLLIASSFWLGLPLFHVIHNELFYQLPQTLSLTFTFLALICWIESKLRGLSKFWLAAGSFFMAQNIGSRPQLMVSAILALPLFWPEICDLWCKGKTSIRGFASEIGVWLCALLPFVVVFIPLLMYNAERFGSYFDFGANYNLTGFDMPNSKLPLSQLVPLSFLYLFQPPNVTTTFPFLSQTNQDMPLWLPMQRSYGGYFTFIAPYAVVVFALYAWRKELKKRSLGFFTLTLAACAVFLFTFNTHLVGYDIRYTLDFGWAIMLLFAIAVLIFDGRRENRTESSDVLLGMVAPAPKWRSNSLRPPSFASRNMLGCVVAGLVLAYLLAFCYVFARSHNSLWWSVYSWFLFV